MTRLLLLLFLAVPLIEIACFILIGQAIGLWPTLAGVLVTAIGGSLVLRMQGISLLAEIRATVGMGQLPARALADAMMVFVAGAFLLTPGYFTDFLGLLLLIPPVRTMIYGTLKRRLGIVTPGSGSPFEMPPKEVRDGTIDLDTEQWRRR